MSTKQNTFKTIKKATNKKGITFVLATYQNAFSVWKLKENYCGQVRGGILKQWACVKKGLSELEATELFNKKVGL